MYAPAIHIFVLDVVLVTKAAGSQFLRPELYQPHGDARGKNLSNIAECCAMESGVAFHRSIASTNGSIVSGKWLNMLHCQRAVFVLFRFSLMIMFGVPNI